GLVRAHGDERLAGDLEARLAPRRALLRVGQFERQPPDVLPRRHGARITLGAMARSWAQLLGDSEAADETEDEQRGFFGRLRESLSKSRRALTDQLAAAAFDPGDDEAWERL